MDALGGDDIGPDDAIGRDHRRAGVGAGFVRVDGLKDFGHPSRRQEVDGTSVAQLWVHAVQPLDGGVTAVHGEEPGEEEIELLGWEEDVRRRLEEYRRYKEVAQELMERATSEAHAFPSPARSVDVEGQEAPLEVELLVNAFRDLLSRVPPRPVTVTGRAWTTEQKVETLTGRLLRGPVNLVDLILECEDRLEAVVTFVALLELLRQARVTVRQKEAFGDITVAWIPR